MHNKPDESSVRSHSQRFCMEKHVGQTVLFQLDSSLLFIRDRAISIRLLSSIHKRIKRRNDRISAAFCISFTIKFSEIHSRNKCYHLEYKLPVLSYY
jgi:hypothetical protein